MRRKMNHRVDRKVFRRTAEKTCQVNLNGLSARGGHRL